jgi:hypothetical protein
MVNGSSCSPALVKKGERGREREKGGGRGRDRECRQTRKRRRGRGRDLRPTCFPGRDYPPVNDPQALEEWVKGLGQPEMAQKVLKEAKFVTVCGEKREKRREREKRKRRKRREEKQMTTLVFSLLSSCPLVLSLFSLSLRLFWLSCPSLFLPLSSPVSLSHRLSICLSSVCRCVSLLSSSFLRTLSATIPLRLVGDTLKR